MKIEKSQIEKIERVNRNEYKTTLKTGDEIVVRRRLDAWKVVVDVVVNNHGLYTNYFSDKLKNLFEQIEKLEFSLHINWEDMGKASNNILSSFLNTSEEL